jgi:hypothetical protein
MCNTRALWLVILSFASAFAFSGEASEVYTFEYTAVTGPVESFSFSFTAPTFVTVGSSPAFAPLTLTDGTNSWAITRDLVELEDPTGLNRGCFQFGTEFAGLSTGQPPFLGPCSFAVGGPGISQGAFEFGTNGLPMAPGIYTPVSFAGAFETPTGFEYIAPITATFEPSGTMMLTITSVVPEPSSLGLVAVGVLFLCAAKKKCKSLSRGKCKP